MEATATGTDVRTRILNAALDLLATGGVQELTQPRVSKAAGIRQSHLTYYFPTINDLLQAVAQHTLERVLEQVRQAGPQARPGSFVDIVAAATADKRRVRTILGLVSAADRDPAMKLRMREFIRELRAGIAPLLREAGFSGTAEEVAFMHSVTVGTALLQLARDDDAARAEARQVLATALAMLRQKEKA